MARRQVVDPVKVKRRHARHLGEPGEVQPAVEVLGQPGDDPLEPGGVVAAGDSLAHGEPVPVWA